MLLIHVSDIHFRTPDCLDPSTDPEQPFRTYLVNDVRQRVNTVGSVESILVTGDIAYKADPKEYEIAMKWLSELAEAAKCPFERVFVVPGNHDVDRKKVSQTTAIRNAHHVILGAGSTQIERVFDQQIRDDTTGSALFEPIHEYNEFAKFFDCQVYPDRICWRNDLELAPGVFLRLHGMTSTLLSGAVQCNGSQDDILGNLYLSPRQTVLDPVPNFVNAALSHHPPDWFKNGDEVDGAINGRAVIQFFGHKHQRRLTREHDYIRLCAGAVNPDRQDLAWQPGYNLVKVCVAGAGADRVLEFEITLLEWQNNPDIFKPVVDRNGCPYFRHNISFPDFASIANAGPAQAEPLPTEIVTEMAMSDTSTRNIIRRFWGLTVSKRLEITLTMGLIEESESLRPELERYSSVFKRASERNILDQLIQEIEKREGE